MEAARMITINPLTIVLFGVTCGLFIGFLLSLGWGPAAPFALAMPLGFYVLWRTVDGAQKGPSK